MHFPPKLRMIRYSDAEVEGIAGHPEEVEPTKDLSVSGEVKERFTCG
ncbi:MAG: hypothetical protein Q8P30_00730 [Candidatus Uhrbacteria bacterium]|nr:hypothetical protein [Candidatus Uhrbacteria bacterium]